ncbi:hypothetical protein D9758_010483 [Tetrapyrgos nigripes]|uniref:Thioredoxin domain-containing protein n=1 Tax=Tetrapyrgos nigripes TaxID=182062 RepID=A0A8H5FVV1_9AGAR|nr:hypothetical protein D9758_010483 [Tetrapyrgos nigripes]
MTSIINTATQAAHAAAASLVAKAQIKPGDAIPSTQNLLKEDAADKPLASLSLTGKNVIVGVPGAFTGTCNKQVPGYIEKYEAFKAKGINEIFVVAVNDLFTMKAWKENLAPNGTPVRFLVDDTGAWVTSLGLLFDATPLLGAPLTEGDKVDFIAVEQVPSDIQVTGAETILAQLS